MPPRRPHRSPRSPWGGVGWDAEVPAAVEHEFGPPAAQCKSQALSDLPERDGLARPLAHVGELGVFIGELRGDRVVNNRECAGNILERACDEARDLPRGAGVELGLDWSDRSRRRVDHQIVELGRSLAVGADSLLSFLGDLREGGRCVPGVLRPEHNVLRVGKGAAS